MGDNKERTFIMIKPDGVQRGLVGKIIQRFEEKGFKLVALKMVWVSVDTSNHISPLSGHRVTNTWYSGSGASNNSTCDTIRRLSSAFDCLCHLDFSSIFF